MNVLHWHITDTNTFPIELFSQEVELMAQYGAYDDLKVYTIDDIKEIVDHSNYRGEFWDFGYVTVTKVM